MESFIVVDHEKIGTLGFSHGGRHSMFANAHFPLAAGVSFYIFHPDEIHNPAMGIRSPHLFFWGALDPGTSRGMIEKFQQGLTETASDFTSVIISYADGGFFCEEQATYNPLAARQAWGHTLSFLDYLLK
jgi:carboxymethylenebutenolidase